MNNLILEADPTSNESPRSARQHSSELQNLSADSAPMSFQSDADSGRMEPVYTAIPADHSQSPRPLKPLRFALGMLLTGCGIAIILLIGIRLIEVRLTGGDVSMPFAAVGVLIGVILLGGGFAIMASSSSGFDEDEFDRLADAGNIFVSAPRHDKSWPSPDTEEPELLTQTRRPA